MPESIDRLNAALEGRYRIKRELGEGGMATVYLADDLKHERKVALKVLKPRLAAVVGAERFLAEIKTTANLQHPHILPLHDSGEADGLLFYVMPYVDGESLRDRLDREHQLPVDEAVRIATDLAQAVDYAHRQGVIHRDIKPANVLLLDERPVIADFGIALAVSVVSGGRLTETGLSLGTPEYMSPEQATGDQSLGRPTDVYALGCVLYEMLVGEPPFTGSTPQAVLGKIVTEDPPSVTEGRKSVPANVEAVVGRALERVPADRFRTASEFAASLADPGFRDRRSAFAGAGRRSHAARRRAALLGLWATVATAVAAWALARPQPAEPVERWTVVDPILARLYGAPAVAPDGSLIIATGTGQVYLKEGRTLQPRLFDEGGEYGPFSVAAFSPDGDEVVFITGGRLKRTGAGGGEVTMLADSAFCCPRWERDGFVYFTGRDRGIERIPVDGERREVVTELSPDEVDPHSDFALLPGGDAGVFYRWGPTVEARIEAVVLETGERTPLVTGRRPYVTLDGRLLYWSADELRVVRVDEKTLTVAGAPLTVEEGVLASVPEGYPMFSLSSDGTLVYRSTDPAGVGRGEARLLWVSRSGAATPVDPGWSFPDPGMGNFGWSLSPGDDRIATFSGEAGSLDIWIKDLPDGPFNPLTFDPGDEVNPTWSPDGREILFASDRAAEGDYDLWAKPADGSGDAHLVYDSDDVVADGRWTPGREWLVMRTIALGNDRNITIASAEDDRLLQLSAPLADVGGPAVSPDGRWLAYYSDESGREEVYVVGFPDLAGPWRISDGGGTKPVWSPRGEELFYVSPEREMVAVKLRAEGVPTVVDREVLFRIPRNFHVAGNADFYSVSRDGERFLMGATDRYVLSNLGQLQVVRNWWASVSRTTSY